jgi:hypothetical protein
MSINTFDPHESDVDDIHDDDKQTPRSPPPPRSRPAVAVGSAAPKFSPDTVRDVDPESGAFKRTSDDTAASKLKTARAVPGAEAMVTLAYLTISYRATARHATEVPEVQEDVEHSAESPETPISSPVVAVCSPTPKSSPDTVKDAPPETGVFKVKMEATAASKLKTA